MTVLLNHLPSLPNPLRFITLSIQFKFLLLQVYEILVFSLSLFLSVITLSRAVISQGHPHTRTVLKDERCVPVQVPDPVPLGERLDRK